ncbi:hypothetical protein ATO11_20520 [Pseudaestuariivita atlantica]|uniref:Uncharacterized protein n=1 Tax=Pseudaestuariivita atlantica TaxID=1317121 RepID=A0A0L1JJB2_9RHOB|nr:hypothetical protein ATO11_20520 [Pseudaestuariivita atlantica]
MIKHTVAAIAHRHLKIVLRPAPIVLALFAGFSICQRRQVINRITNANKRRELQVCRKSDDVFTLEIRGEVYPERCVTNRFWEGSQGIGLITSNPDDDRPPTRLRHAKMRRVEDLHIGAVSMVTQRQEDRLQGASSLEGNKPRDILNQNRLRLKLINKAQKL